MKSKLLLISPVLIFLLLTLLLWKGIGKDPQNLPSALLNKPVPEFTLNTFNGSFNQEDFKGRVSLLNVFATWCYACKQEHPTLLKLAQDNTIFLVGLNYKDDLHELKQWLAKHGDPYNEILLDQKGMVAIDFGVYGAPETYVIDKSGIIRYKHVGVVTNQIIQTQIMPLVKKLSSDERRA